MVDWLIADQVVANIDVKAWWSTTSRNRVEFSITAYQPTGPSPDNFQFSLAWEDLS